MYYYFYDFNELLLDRYPAHIAAEIVEKEPDARFVFLYSEVYPNYGAPRSLPKGSIVEYVPSLLQSDIQRLFDAYPPRGLTVIGQRIPDMVFISICNRLNIPTFMVQHGFLTHLERHSVILLLIERMKKFLQYVRGTIEIAKNLPSPWLKVITDFYLFFIRGTIDFPDSDVINAPELLARYALLFDADSGPFYTRRYGYTKKHFKYIGNPDFTLLNAYDGQSPEDAVCYICQSLVEDGRIGKREYLKFIREMAKTIPPDKKLYIKLHPRSNSKLYEDCERPNIEMVEHFPFCTFYLGHYSSMLYVTLEFAQEVLLFEMETHRIPKEFHSLAEKYYNNWDEVVERIRVPVVDEKTYAFNYPNPYEKSAEIIKGSSLFCMGNR